MASRSRKSPRGFAAMSPEERRRISAMGGHASHGGGRRRDHHSSDEYSHMASRRTNEGDYSRGPQNMRGYSEYNDYGYMPDDRSYRGSERIRDNQEPRRRDYGHNEYHQEERPRYSRSSGMEHPQRHRDFDVDERESYRTRPERAGYADDFESERFVRDDEDNWDAGYRSNRRQGREYGGRY